MTREAQRQASGTTIDSPTDVTAFLEEHPEAPGFELTYASTAANRPRVLTDIEPVRSTLERPAAAPTFECTPANGARDTFTVRADAIERIAVADHRHPDDAEGADAVADEARGVRRFVERDPTMVALPTLLDLLDRTSNDREGREYTLEALRIVATDRPAECTAAVPPVRDCLREQPAAPAAALGGLRAIGEETPVEIAPAIDDIRPYLRANDDSARHEAARCVAAIAEHDPTDILPAVDALAEIIDRRALGFPYAVYALSQLTKAAPDAVQPATAALTDAVTNDDHSEGVRLNATAALGRIVQNTPTTGVDIAAGVAGLLHADSDKLQNNGIAFLGDIAKIHADAARPYVAEFAAALTTEDRLARINASCALSRIADDYPSDIRPYTQDLVRLLDDDDPVVRKNACWALGHVQAATATPDLERLAGNDPDEDVRIRAAWAISQIEPD